MNSEFLQKLIALCAKTGDKMVVADPASGKSYVVMDLESYERILGIAVPSVPAASAPVASQAAVEMPAPRPQSVFSRQKPPETPRNSDDGKVEFFAEESGKTVHYDAPSASASPDLTQEELLYKINRDIGDWKTAQERKRAQVLRSAANGRSEPRRAPRIAAQPPKVSKPQPVEPVDQLEEEEQFFLEPIE